MTDGSDHAVWQEFDGRYRPLLMAVGRRLASKSIATWGLLIGLVAGFVTDAIVTAAGA